MNDIKLWENIKKTVRPLAKRQVVEYLYFHNIKVQPGTIIPYTLDLHGYTIQEAYDKLQEFVIQHIENKTKYITVITGKGSPNKESLIHKEIKNWLDNIFFKNYVKSFEWINGNGALRIYLIRHNK